MASIQAKHRRGVCALPNHYSAAPHGKPEGCTCQPTYFLFYRHDGKQRSELVGRDYREAHRRKVKLEEALEQGRHKPIENVSFTTFAQEWRETRRKAKETTREGYKSTTDWAERIFGQKVMRQIKPNDIRALLRAMEEAGISKSTQAKHLRILKALFDAAVKRGYAGLNPIRELDEGELPEAERNEAPYFTNAEIPKLLAGFDDPLFRNLAALALATGLRQGELVALRWRDVDLTNAQIYVRDSVRNGKLNQTKNKERRTVDLEESAVKLLGEHWRDHGGGDDYLVFPGFGNSYLKGWVILNRLIRAMERGGVSRACPEGKPFGIDRNFHSLRHTHARIVLERGVSIAELSHRLGHKSVAITDSTYRHWSQEAGRQVAERLNGAFSFV